MFGIAYTRGRSIPCIALSNWTYVGCPNNPSCKESPNHMNLVAVEAKTRNQRR